MNVHPGGAQPRMWDTYYNGKQQKMVFPDGTPKGMKQVLEERELNVSKMKAEDIRENFRVCMILNMRKLK